MKYIVGSLCFELIILIIHITKIYFKKSEGLKVLDIVFIEMSLPRGYHYCQLGHKGCCCLFRPCPNSPP